MATAHGEGRGICAAKDEDWACPNTYDDHHWGKKKADQEGWFFQKNGDAWCPEHTPAWVQDWRKRTR